VCSSDLYYLNLIYSFTGEISKNETVLIDLSDIANEIYTKKSDEFMHVNYSLANLYFTKQNRLEDCEPLLKIGLDYYEGKKDLNNFIYGNYLMLSAGLNSKKKNYDLSTKIYLETIRIYEYNHINEEANDNFSYYLSCINNIGLNYLESGNYKEADFYLSKAYNYLQPKIKSSKLFIPFYLLNIANLSRLYYYLGRYEAGKNICFEALTSLNINDVNADFNKQQILESLGIIYIELGEYSKAKGFLEHGLEISRIINKKESNEHIIALNNLALCYDSLGEHSKAEDIYLETFNINFDPITANNLALLYVETKNFKKASFFYKKAMKLSNDIYNNAFKRNLLGSIYYYYRILNDVKNGKKYLLKHSKLFQNQILDYLNFSSNNEINEIFSNLIREKGLALSFNNDFQNKFFKINISNYENDLLLKNLILRNQKIIQKTIFESNNKILIDKYNLLKSKKRELNKLNELNVNQKPSNYIEITKETEQIEKDIISISSKYVIARHQLLPDWKKIKKSLKPNEISLNLVTFNYIDTLETSNILYAIYLVRKESNYPKYIYLFEQKQLELLLDFKDEKNKNDNIDKQYSNKSISDLFLKPLERELEGITNIYLSPSGLGHQIDFAALPINDSQTLGEKYKLHILSSPAELMDYKVATLDKKSNIELLLYGGIDYDTSQGKSNISLNNNLISLDEELNNLAKRSGFDKLPGTLKEVESITENAKSSGFSCKVIKESEATEESVKALDGRTTPYVLHLATHGFFFPDPIQETPKDNKSFEGKSKIYKASDDPMMRSGLLLAGAKNYWGKTNQNNTNRYFI
jgi:tetratricopeptide (TPR) repeat protein